MGRKSNKENKNIYQLCREGAGLTREAAAAGMDFISASRIEKIESERSLPHPEEILAMAKCYKNPSLCNHYCSHECPIGIEYVDEIEEKNISQITLEMMVTINKLVIDRDRLMEITVDGKITEDEYEDFKNIRKHLLEMSQAINSMKLWIDNTIAAGELDSEALS